MQLDFVTSLLTYLNDPNDQTLLTKKEIKKSWRSFSNFMISYGLKPYNQEDCEEADAISRALKKANQEED